MVTDIYDWADYQDNCIVNYKYSIYFRKVYLYSIEYKNETATFEILIENSGHLMGDLLGTRNKPVSENLKDMVSEWFRKKTRGLKRYKYRIVS